MTREKDILYHIRVDERSANRLEIDRLEKNFESVSDQFEKVIWFYLSHEAGSETERLRYQEKIIAEKCSSLNNAMREDNKQGLINNIVEIMVRIFLYKRRNLNKLDHEKYTLDLFRILEIINNHDKNLFDEILNIMKIFGIKSNKYRSFINKSGSVDTTLSYYNNNTITNSNNNIITESVTEKEKETKRDES